MRGLAALASMAALVIVYYICAQALTSPELTARYNARTQAQLQAEQARQQTQMVRAQEDGRTSRVWAQTWETWGVYGTSAAGVAVVAFVGGWAVVEWQRQRTRRHEVTEDHTTQRHSISAKRDIVLAYLVQFGEPGAKPMTLNGVYGAYLPSANEFVPEHVCRAELATVRTAQPANHTTALARRQPQTINVPGAMERDDWPPVGLPGDDGGRRFRVIGELEEW